MLITIAGCGALGSLLAARLIEGGAEVQVFQRKGRHLDALRENGITIEADRTGSTRNFRLARVSDDPAELTSSGLIIVLVKAYSTQAVAPVQNILEARGSVLTLQNGLGNPEKLVPIFGKEKVAAGVTTYGAYRIAPGVIGWGGDGYITLGPWEKAQDMSWIADMLKNTGLNAAYTPDPRPAIWKKLAINAMINPATALTRRKNGKMLDFPLILDLMKNLCRETLTAAERAGVSLDSDEIWSMLLESLEKTAANTSSMLQDVKAGRETECDAISGGVLQYARNDGEFPYTRSLYALLKAIGVRGES